MSIKILQVDLRHLSTNNHILLSNVFFSFLLYMLKKKIYEIARDMEKWSKYLTPYCFCIAAGSSCLGEVNDCE